MKVCSQLLQVGVYNMRELRIYINCLLVSSFHR